MSDSPNNQNTNTHIYKSNNHSDMDRDSVYMLVALEEAKKAEEKGEVPVGAIVVREDEIISRGHNMKEISNDPTAHAEIIAIREAALRLGRWRLSGCTLYVTKEPCPMCAGAIINARIDRVVFGCVDEKGGGGGSVYNILEGRRLNHSPEVRTGVFEEETAGVLKRFFQSKRRGGRVV